MTLSRRMRLLTHPDDIEDPEVQESLNRRRQISLQDLKDYGYTDKCRRCADHKQGLHARAKHLRHDEVCISRIYKAIKDAKGPGNEEEDKRLEARSKSRKVQNEPKPVVDSVNPETPKDISMDADPIVDLEIPE